jgi:hypothetical protein
MSEQTPTPVTPPGPSIAQRLVAEAVGLPEALASRIVQTDDVAAMKADAEALKALAQPTAPDPQDGLDGGTRREQPNGGMTRAAIADLARRDPARFNEMVENGTLNLSKVTR